MLVKINEAYYNPLHVKAIYGTVKGDETYTVIDLGGEDAFFVESLTPDQVAVKFDRAWEKM